MEQEKIRIKCEEEFVSDELPLVARSNRHLDEDIQENKMIQTHIPNKLNYVFVEFFLCAIILLGILILQSVKNTEDLQLAIRENLRHDLTLEESRTLKDDVLETVQHYQNGRP